MQSRRSNRKPPQGLAILVLALMVGGCGNMSGLGGSEHYGCKAPAGVQCQSVSGNYVNLVRGTTRLPSAGGGPNRLQPAALTKVSFHANGTVAPQEADDALGYTPIPLRSPPRVLRLWVKAWEDADHDLVDQSYVYVRVDQGKWTLDHVQRQAREAYAPLRPPAKDPVATAPTPVIPALGAPASAVQGNAGPLQGFEPGAAGSAIGAR